LLRFLQDKEFYRLGSTKALRADVRIIAATNRNLEKLASEEKFRSDLILPTECHQDKCSASQGEKGRYSDPSLTISFGSTPSAKEKRSEEYPPSSADYFEPSIFREMSESLKMQ